MDRLPHDNPPSGDSSLASPSSRPHALLAEERQRSVESGELVQLILSGTRRIDSWLIEHRVLPALLDEDAPILSFFHTLRDGARRSAILVPLADGSAFACSTQDRWSIFEKREALSAVQYLGLRYAPENEWAAGFEATQRTIRKEPRPVRPFEVADIWEDVTGVRPHGFEHGMLDDMQALGYKIIGRAFNSQGRLGL